MQFKNILKHTVILSAIIIAVSSFTSDSKDLFLINKNMEIFSDIYKNLDLFYVDELDHNTLFKEAIDDMLRTLDPYTNYISADDIESYRFETTGKYAGIGTLISKTDSGIIFSEVMDESPAAKGGVKVGYQLMKVNGESIQDLTTEQVSVRLKGQKGTEVTLTVLPPFENETQDLLVIRDEIERKNVSYSTLLKNDIAYVKLDQFTFNAAENIKQSIKEYSDTTDLQGIVIDLRSNPGGLLNEAVKIVNLFIPQGKQVVYTKGKIEEWNNEWTTSEPPVFPEIPVTVLINGNSASASEIVSGALQDYDRAVIIGENSFGKGLVQQTRDLAYNSKLKLTTAKYYIPSGRCIQRAKYYSFDTTNTVGEFTTMNGRKVLDKGGVDPDIKIEDRILSEISTDLLANRHIFNMAIESVYNNNTFSTAQEIITYLSAKNYEFKSKHQRYLSAYMSKLETVSESDSIILNNMKQAADIDYKTLVNEFQEELVEIIQTEIIRIKENEYNTYKKQLENDPVLTKASNIILEPKTYNGILSNN